MISVNKTVGTTGAVSLCTGKGIFHRNGTDLTIPLGYEKSWTFFQNDNGNCGGEFYMGVCGPAWALKMEMVGQVDGNKLTLDPPTYECNAGMVMGVGLTTFTLHGHADMLFASFDFSMTVAEVDFLAILIWAYEQATGKKLMPEKTPSAFAHKAFGMNDDRNGTIDSALTIIRSPTLSVEWDLLESFIAFTAPEAIPEYNALKWVAEISFGPEFAIILNVELKMSSVNVGGMEYTNLSYNGTTKKVIGTTSGTAEPTSADVVKVTFHETPSINFALGFFFEFKLIQIFSIRGDFYLDALNGLGFTLSGAYDQTVDSTSFAAPCFPCSGGIAGVDRYEVEFV